MPKLRLGLGITLGHGNTLEAPTVITAGAFAGAATAGMTVAASVKQLAAVTMAGGTALVANSIVGVIALEADSAIAGLAGAATVTELTSPALAATAGLAVGAGSLPPVAGYTAWYDASQIAGVADNTALASWPDLSGTGSALIQGTAGQQPIYFSSTAGKTVNGLPAVWFNSAQFQSMSTQNATWAQAQPLTICAVVQTLSPSSTQMLVCSAANAFLLKLQASGWTEAAGSAIGSLSSAADGNLHVVEAVFNGLSSSLTLDGTTRNTSPSNPGTTGISSGFKISLFGTSQNYWNGPICELLIYPSALNSTDLASVGNYLTTKWGGLRTDIGAAPLSATAALTVTPQITEVAATSQTATAGMTLAASVHQLAAVTLAGGTSLNATGTWVQQASVVMADSASLAAGAQVTELASVVQLAGASGMFVGVVVELAAAAMVASTALMASAGVTEIASVNVTATTSMVVAGMATVFAVVGQTSGAGLVANALVDIIGVVGEAVGASMQADASVDIIASVNQTASPGMTASAVVDVLASVGIAGTAGFAANASVDVIASVNQTASPGMTADAVVDVLASTIQIATPGLEADASVDIIASINQTASPGLEADASVDVIASINQVASPGLEADAFVDVFASAAEVAAASLEAETGLGLHGPLILTPGVAQVQYRGGNSELNSTSSTTVTFLAPTAGNVVAGDIWILSACFRAGSTVTISGVPAAFHLIGRVDEGSATTACTIVSYYYTCLGTETAGASVGTITLSTASKSITVTDAFSDVNPSAPAVSGSIKTAVAAATATVTPAAFSAGQVAYGFGGEQGSATSPTMAGTGVTPTEHTVTTGGTAATNVGGAGGYDTTSGGASWGLSNVSQATGCVQTFTIDVGPAIDLGVVPLAGTAGMTVAGAITTLHSGPNYAGASSGLSGGTGSWVSPTNADGAPDSVYASWTAP